MWYAASGEAKTARLLSEEGTETRSGALCGSRRSECVGNSEWLSFSAW
jgi:hypothetical protein